ncbi:sodium-independent sulfate anion transporter isoform X5 [Cygnus olor]|uniref:sodium-independent sulfate anion transporter isoform X5 n=1 Tax=Cygnus olor TaxID=8869 RepID=UPI001ADDED1C|nr:sodium-independent sulfate anion transporter isoform X5 [Cygnus olor]
MWARGPPEPRRRCWLRAVRRRLPILGWLPRYSPGWLQLDLIAGVTVGLTVVPQALAYAEVAGLPPQYGLYSSFVGCFVYCFLGTAKDVTLGPTAIMSLLVSSYAFHDPVYAVLLTFLAGCIQLAMGLLHLGFLLDFISCPVIKGFTSAASITISFNQVKNILGLHGIPRQFFLQVYETLRRIGETSTQRPRGPVCWPGGLLLPAEGLPAADAHRQHPPRPPPLPAAALLQGCAQRHRALRDDGGASQNDYRIDPNQELLAMGFANVLGSFFSSYPVTGSFGRTAVNAQTGVCTPAGGLVTGALVLLSLAYLTSLFYYIPKAALAAVIISAVVPMFDAGIFRTLWRVKSEGTSGAAVPRLSLRATALPGSMRAGPCPPLRDVPVLLLGGAVRHCGRGAGLRDPAALLHRQAPAEGVGAGHAAGAAGEQPALPSHRAPPGCHLQPRSVSSTLTMLHHPGLPPHQQHRLHGGGGAGRAAAGAAQARHLAGLLQSAGPGSPSPAGCRPGRIPTFPQLGGGRAVQRSGAGRQRGSPLRQHQRQRELAAAHGAHPVRQRSRVGLSQDHISLPEQLFPMAPEAARPVQAGQCPAV